MLKKENGSTDLHGILVLIQGTLMEIGGYFSIFSQLRENITEVKMCNINIQVDDMFTKNF